MNLENDLESSKFLYLSLVEDFVPNFDLLVSGPPNQTKSPDMPYGPSFVLIVP